MKASSIATMTAMVLDAPGQPLRQARVQAPRPGEGQVLVRVHACGVCRTDLHVAAGELTVCRLPLVLGHEIVGTVMETGPAVARLEVGDRVGIPWLAWTCGVCPYCRSGRENLCDRALFTGCHRDGGYAEYAAAYERYCLPLPPSYDDVKAAPLLCAGLIGYRALRAAGDARRIGLYGFGAAAHLVAQVARYEGREVFAFTREGDSEGQAFARELGATWAGSSTEAPPEPLDAGILFAPVGSLVPVALQAVVKGGTVVCAGIHMSPIPSFPYELLWGERCIRSVANLTRRDGEEFLRLAEKAALRVETEAMRLADANQALERLRLGQVKGATVLLPHPRGAAMEP